jgi:hypothetical protein
MYIYMYVCMYVFMSDEILPPLTGPTPNCRVRQQLVYVSEFPRNLFVPLTQSRPRSCAAWDQSRRTRRVSTVSNSQWAPKFLSKRKRNVTGLFIRDIVHLHLKDLRPRQVTKVITSNTHFSLHIYHILV